MENSVLEMQTIIDYSEQLESLIIGQELLLNELQAINVFFYILVFGLIFVFVIYFIYALLKKFITIGG